jgi:DNA repair exonuclease SbcCD nuclease subunit
MLKDFILVGDPHVVVEELDECRRLAAFILEKQRQRPQATTVLLGDLYNNHSNIRVEVLAFWENFFAQARNTIAIVGNHDRPHRGGEGEHALMAHTNATVVDLPTIIDGVGFMPYMDTPEAFLEALSDLGARFDFKHLFCHQTFQGARYEAGFYAPDGVSTEALPIGLQVISGHIHSPQRIGRVWYPGAPRWRSIADANVDRFIYLVRLDVTSSAEAEVMERWPTETAGCIPIRIQTVTNEEELEAIAPAPGLRIQIQGAEAFVKAAEKRLKDRGVRFRSQIDGTQMSSRVKESEGIGTAFGHYLEAFEAPQKTPKNILRQLVAQRISW